MLKLLQEGTNLIIDRYAYSGVAFTAAKPVFINSLIYNMFSTAPNQSLARSAPIY